LLLHNTQSTVDFDCRACTAVADARAARCLQRVDFAQTSDQPNPVQAAGSAAAADAFLACTLEPGLVNVCLLSLDSWTDGVRMCCTELVTCMGVGARQEGRHRRDVVVGSVLPLQRQPQLLGHSRHHSSLSLPGRAEMGCCCPALSIVALRLSAVHSHKEQRTQAWPGQCSLLTYGTHRA
jgi:hypothetical protein